MTAWHILNSALVQLILIPLVAAFAVIGFNDWYRRRREARKESRTRELEALFARPDRREVRELRP